MKQLEVAVEQACRRYAMKHDCMFLKIKGNTGWPDRLLLTPHGYHVFVEFKREGEEPRDLQLHILEGLNKNGHGALWIDNLESFKKLVTYLLSLPPRGSLVSTKLEE